MKYTMLNLQQNSTNLEFKYSENKDDAERVEQKFQILGMPGAAFCYAPRGEEDKCREQLFDYVQNSLKKEIDRSQKLLYELNEIRSRLSKGKVTLVE